MNAANCSRKFSRTKETWKGIEHKTEHLELKPLNLKSEILSMFQVHSRSIDDCRAKARNTNAVSGQFYGPFFIQDNAKRSTILFWIQIGIHYKQLHIAFNLGSSRCLNCEVKFGINIPLKLGFKTVIGIISGLLTSKCQSTMKAKQMVWTAKKDNERNKNNSSRQTDKK